MEKRIERPMLYSTEMVRSIDDERKTKTRRMKGLEEINQSPDDWNLFGIELGNTLGKGMVTIAGFESPTKKGYIPCPYGKPGDLLWVRETFYQYGHWSRNGLTKTGRPKWQFLPYDDDIRFYFNPPDRFEISRNRTDPQAPRWYKRLGRFLPKTASRTWLQITDIRVERLHDITEEDAMAEGVEWEPFSYEEGFETLWATINGQESWNLNPWVWVISFKVFRTTERPGRVDLLNNRGNIDDIRNSIRCGWKSVSLADLQASIEDELKTRKRSTVVKLLESSLNKKRKEVGHA